MNSGERQNAAPGGPWFWGATAIGMGMIAFGVLGLFRHSAETMPLGWAKFFFGGLIIHDGFWAPFIGMASLGFVRFVPAWVRPTVQGGLIVSAACVLVTIPALTGRGRLATNPSILPNDYRGDLLLVLAIVWAVAAVLAVRARRRPPTATDPPKPIEYPTQNGW